MSSQIRDAMIEFEDIARDIGEFLKANPSAEEMRSKLEQIRVNAWEEYNDIKYYLGYND